MTYALCGTEFDVTPEGLAAAVEEARERYRDDPEALADLDDNGPAILCDDCYDFFLEWYRKERHE